MEPDQASTKKGPACPSCGGRLRLRADQIGTQVTCPKCGSTFAVGRPGQATSKSTSDDDAYEPEIPLKRSSIVPEEELSGAIPASHHNEYDVDWGSAVPEREPPHVRPLDLQTDYLEVAKAKGLLRMEYMPDPPRWTFFSGVFLSPWRVPNVGRWGVMTFGLSISATMGLATLKSLGMMDAYLTSLPMGGLLLAIFTIIIALATASYCASCCWAVIQDTADGHELALESTLPELNQWLFTFLGMLMLWAASASLGYPLSLWEPIGVAGIFGSSLLVFPVLLLSAMEADSYMLPISLPVLATLRRLWWGWLVFYLLSGVLVVGSFALMRWGVSVAPYTTMWAAGPLLAAVLLIYARLLGRVAWRASGMPVASRDETPADKAQRGKRKRRQRLRLEVPDDLELATQMLAEQPPPLPRANYRIRG